MNLLVFGLGFTAGFYASHAVSRFDSVTGTKRSPQAMPGVTVLPFDGGSDRVDERLRAALLEADALLVSAGPDAQGDPVLRRLEAEIAAAPRLKKIVYLSTIGVYGDHGGAWIDESARTAPGQRAQPRAARRRGAMARSGRTDGQGGLCVAPLRHLRPRPQRAGEIARGDGASGWSSRDRSSTASMSRTSRAPSTPACSGEAPGGVYNVTDDEPAPPQDVVLYAAILLGVAPPPEQDFVAAALTPMARSFYGENKRVSNMRMKAELGVELAFPTFREGIAALAAQGE